MNDIIAFIERAMKENLNIEVRIEEDNDYKYYIAYINSDNKFIKIECNIHNNKRVLKLDKIYLNTVTVEISEMDIALFKVELLKAQKYSENKVIEAFNKFFDDKDNIPTTINDLDNEDD